MDLYEKATWRPGARVARRWWEQTGIDWKALDSFQSRVARKITGKQPRRRKDGSWFYPPVARVMKETGLVGIRTSILRRQNTVA